MAYSTQQIKLTHLIFGGSAFALLLVLTLGTVLVLWLNADIKTTLSPSDWATINFTITQAIVSATLSVLIAVPTARALFFRNFKGRQFILTIMGAPFILPTIVAILGIIAVWGRSGYISEFISNFSINPLNIYGFTGVVLAHVFLTFH